MLFAKGILTGLNAIQNYSSPETTSPCKSIYNLTVVEGSSFKINWKFLLFSFFQLKFAL